MSAAPGMTLIPSARAEAFGEHDDAEFGACVARYGSIQGFLHDVEGYALMRLAARPGPAGRVVEIGSFMGKSTCWLAHGVRLAHERGAPAAKVAAVDHFEGSREHRPGGTHEIAEIVGEGTTYRRFQENIRAAGLEDWVQPIRAHSLQAVKDWTEPVRLIFIDGDHSYGASLSDFRAWSPFVVTGGVLCLHDVGAWRGVTRFYLELTQHSKEFREIGGAGSLRAFQRIG